MSIQLYMLDKILENNLQSVNINTAASLWNFLISFIFSEYNFTEFSTICLLVFLPDGFKAFLVEGLAREP